MKRPRAFSASYDAKLKTVAIRTPASTAIWHIDEKEAAELRQQITFAIWKIRAQQREERKRERRTRKEGAA